jgi:glycosyltransferase involved in cell wall biosynthesis
VEELVSIVIPTFNRPWSLKRAVRSVFCQTYPHFELIVVDDGSETPASKALNNGYDSRLRIVRHDINKGVSAARNTGVEEARGPWVAFLDDDDIWAPRKLEEQVYHMRWRAPEADASVTDFVEKNSRRISGTYRRGMGMGVDYSILSWQGMGLGSTLLAKRKVFDDVGHFDPAFSRTEDWEWLLRFYLKGKRLVTVPGILTEYTEKTYRNGVPSPPHFTLEVADKHRARIHAKSSPDLARAFEVYVCLRQANDDFKAGRPSQALGHIAQAMAHDPRETLRCLIDVAKTTAGRQAFRCALNNLRPG